MRSYLPNAARATALPPSVGSILPATGTFLGSVAVTVSGTGFGASPSLKIGGVAATLVVRVNETTITALTPVLGGPGVVNVVVTNGDGQTSGTSGNGKYTGT